MKESCWFIIFIIKSDPNITGVDAVVILWVVFFWSTLHFRVREWTFWDCYCILNDPWPLWFFGIGLIHQPIIPNLLMWSDILWYDTDPILIDYWYHYYYYKVDHEICSFTLIKKTFQFNVSFSFRCFLQGLITPN